MGNSINDRILSSLTNLETFFENNTEAQEYIDSLITANFLEENLNEAFEAIKDIYGGKVSKDISVLLSFSNRSLSVINDNGETYKFHKFYKLLIHKFRRKFVRLRNLEENGASTLMYITETFDDTGINYSGQRANKSYLEFKLTHDSHLSVIEYFITAFDRYITWSSLLDQDDLENFIEDLQGIKQSLNELESTLQTAVEEQQND